MGGYSTQFGTDLLSRLGAPVTQENLKFLAAWAQAEGGNATYNPFNTTVSRPNTTWYNSFGSNKQYHVLNYPDYATGLDATASTIQQSNMAPILAALKSGTSAEVDAQSLAKTPWGTGAGALAVLQGGGAKNVPATSSAGKAYSVGGDTVDTHACYWGVGGGTLLGVVGTPKVCLDPILWVALGLVSSGALLLGGALVAIDSGVGGSGARKIVSTIGPGAVAGKVAGKVMAKAS